jgi:polyisoprenoid-binding protein YceI
MNQTAEDPQKTGRSRRGLWIGLGVLALIVVVAGVALFWYFNRDVPEEVSLEAAVAGVTETTTAGSDPTSTTTTITPADETGSSGGNDIEGPWTVDTSIGEFSFAEASASFAGFRINEELAGIGETEAVGRTPDVAGTMVFEGTTLVATTIEADLTGIVTNESRRDKRVQSSLDTGTFPIATFELTEPIDLGGVPAEGEPVLVTAVGEMTIHGITNPLEIPLEAQLVDDLIVVVGSTEIVFADYDVTVPSARVVLSVEDRGTLEIQLLMARA